LLSRPRKSLTAEEEFPEILLEYRQKLERDLLAKVNATLTPLLGEDHYRAGITVECDMTSAEASEEIYDPEKAVVTSEQKTEDTSGIPAPAGVPGTPSNLPRPVTKPVSVQTSSQRKTESTNYQASRSIRRTKIPQGQIKRVSLSVLLDQNMRWEGTGQKARRVFETPAPEKIKAIKDVVSAAIGLVADRGDQVIVESLPFDATLRIPAPEAPTPPAPPKPIIEIPESLLKNLPPPLRDPNILLAVAAGAVLGILILLFAVFWFLRKRKKAAKAKTQAGAAAAIEGTDPVAAAKAELGEDDGRSFEERMVEQQTIQKRIEEKELAKLRFPELTTQKSKLLIQHITEEAEKDPLMIAQILRSWLQQEYKEKR
jgi:flagellar M-ring protein FliF